MFADLHLVDQQEKEHRAWTKGTIRGYYTGIIIYSLGYYRGSIWEFPKIGDPNIVP